MATLKGAPTIDTHVSPELSTLLAHLTQPQAFPDTLAKDEAISLIQTHASAVLLAGSHAYKLKKARDFGFFDYSTPELRRHFCEQEVVLNSRLAPQVYLGVAPVLARPDQTFHIGPTCAPGQIPVPGSQVEDGQVIDYMVVMQRLPEEATLASYVAMGKATPEQLAAVAAPIARFHTSVPTTKYIADFGSLRVIRGNWQENFEQMRPYIGRSLDQITFDRISSYIHEFCDGYAALFTTRMREQHIRDCHGDLRLQHVYILPGEHDTLDISVVDCIEFNERFRYSDVAAEIAFLTMELDAAGRPDLGRAFVDSYVKHTGDQALYELLPFYACYRACVRGKVLSFQLDQPEVPAEQREAVRREAEALFSLAASYASGPTRPTLLLVGGLMGTGKSTLATELQTELGWALFSSDSTRKQLARQDESEQKQSDYGEGLYTPAWNARVYQHLLEGAARQLAMGKSVILDATFGKRAHRHAAAQEAALHSANLVFVECQTPRGIALERLTRRQQARLAGQEQTISADSDARPDLYDAQAEAWQPFYAEEEPATEYLPVATSAELSTSLIGVLDALSIPLTLRRP
ncbi:MAG TPA: AAA family ATPase [Ktedonobacteraceae bacterium]|nr:AAA family ATPase [Ktedonobacteraceae bacterium]